MRRHLQLLLWNAGLLALVAVPLGVVAQFFLWPRELGPFGPGEAVYAWYLYVVSMLPGAVAHYLACRGLLAIAVALPARIASLAASPLVLSWWLLELPGARIDLGVRVASALVVPLGLIVLAYGAVARVRVARSTPTRGG